MKADRLWCRSWRPLGVPRASNAQFCPALRVFPTYLYADPFQYISRHFFNETLSTNGSRIGHLSNKIQKISKNQNKSLKNYSNYF